MSDHELLQLAEKIAAEARSGEQVEAYVARGRRTDARAYNGEVESLSQAESAGIGVRVVAGGRQGFAYAGTLDPDAVTEVLAEARDNATFGTVDEHLGLAEPDGATPVDLDLYRPELAEVATETKVDLALELERRVKARDPRIKGVRISMYGDGLGEAAVVTSTGIRAHSRSSRCYLSVQALAVEGDETQIGSGVSVGRTLADLDLDEAAGDAADRATRLLGSRKAPSQKLTIVLDPDVTASFLAIIGGTLNGEAVLKGRSLFANRVGEQVAAPELTFVDDPTDPDSLAADAHDDEGLASRRNVLVDAGVLQGFLHNTYSGRRAGTPSTASAVRGYSSTPAVGARALAIAPGTLTQDELLAEVGSGLLVQGVNGLHSGVNPVSGDFSVGATGIMFRDGTLAEPVREITIASTLQRMLLDIVAVGGDLDWTPGGTGAVSLAIRDVAVSGS